MEFNTRLLFGKRARSNQYLTKGKNIHQSHGIYKGTYICGQTYIGETACNQEVRVNEHSAVNGQSEPAMRVIKQARKSQVIFSTFSVTTAHSWMNRTCG